MSSCCIWTLTTASLWWMLMSTSHRRFVSLFSRSSLSGFLSLFLRSYWTVIVWLSCSILFWLCGPLKITCHVKSFYWSLLCGPCVQSFHCSSPKKMPFSRMDPSCTIGFYAKNKKDFESLCSAVSVVSFSTLRLLSDSKLKKIYITEENCIPKQIFCLSFWQIESSKVAFFVVQNSSLCYYPSTAAQLGNTVQGDAKEEFCTKKQCVDQVLLSSQALSSSKEKYPIFTFVEGHSQDYGLEGHSSNNSGPAAHILPPGKLGKSNNRRNSDEFVFL